MQQDSKFLPSSLIFCTIFALMSCGNHKNEDKVNVTENPNIKTLSTQTEISGENYSDSMSNVLISELLEKNEPLIIDTFNDLHSFDKSMFITRDCIKFNIEKISELSAISSPITKKQNKLLGVTDYLCDKTFSDFFNTYIFYTKSNESHYGDAVELVNIENSSNKFRKLTLCQAYLSEGYEYELNSRFLSYNEIEITKTEKFKTSNISKTDDSIRIDSNIYLIDESGNIEKKE